MKYNCLPSQEYLKECFNYDPDTGILRWKERPREHFNSIRICNWWNTKYKNSIIDTIDGKLYYQVYIDSKKYLAHRIIWKLMTGNDPKQLIDHINGIRNDNRWSNLREATFKENCRNRKIHKNNKSGYKGISYNKTNNKWQGQILVGNKRIWLGYFNTAEEAYDAYCKAADKYHGEFKNAG